MLNLEPIEEHTWNFMAGAGQEPPALLADSAEADLWLYRDATLALLRRYRHASIEVGRLPSLLGREVFRARLTSYAMKNFEDVVIFVTDMEHALERLDKLDQILLTMHVLEECTMAEVSRLLHYPPRTMERLFQEAVDELSRVLLAGGLLERFPGEEAQ